MCPRTIGHLENIFTPAPASRAIFYLTIVKIQCCTIPIQYWVYTRNVLLRRLMLEIQSLTNPNYVGWGPDPIIMTQIVVINWEKNKQSLTKYFVFLPNRIPSRRQKAGCRLVGRVFKIFVVLWTQLITGNKKSIFIPKLKSIFGFLQPLNEWRVVFTFTDLQCAVGNSGPYNYNSFENINNLKCHSLCKIRPIRADEIKSKYLIITLS